MPLHWLGFAMNAVGAGLLSILNERSTIAAWVCFQILASGGVGLLFTVTLPSTLAPLHESDVAVATGTYSFVRLFGMVWGVTMASIVFNDQFNQNLDIIGDANTRGVLADGAAYAYASGGFIPGLPSTTRSGVIEVYVAVLRTVWIVIAAVSCLGFSCVFIERHVDLRKTHATGFGLAERKVKTHNDEEGARSLEKNQTNTL